MGAGCHRILNQLSSLETARWVRWKYQCWTVPIHIYIYDIYMICTSIWVLLLGNPYHLLTFSKNSHPFEIGSDEPWLQMDQGTQGLAERRAYLWMHWSLPRPPSFEQRRSCKRGFSVPRWGFGSSRCATVFFSAEQIHKNSTKKNTCKLCITIVKILNFLQESLQVSMFRFHFSSAGPKFVFVFQNA